MIHQGTLEIKTDRLILRRFTLDDAEPMYTNWASDPEVTKFLTWPSHDSLDVTRKILIDWVMKYDQLDYYQWAIVPLENDEPIGSISVVHTDDRIDMVHIGYCIGQQWWNKGYTSEALQAILDFFFVGGKVNRIEACFDVKNANSGKVMQKCGLKFEGVKRQAELNNQGVCDISEYSILAEDYFIQLFNSKY